MEPKATAKSTRLLADLLELPEWEQQWILREYWTALDPAEREALAFLFSESTETGTHTPSLFELAKSRLLDDTGLTAGEKVLLAALMLRELYEIEDFNSRQITENLRDLATPVNNVTAALNGLIAKGEVTIADPARAARNAHKRYRLSAEGLLSATALARPPQRSRRSAG